MENEDRLQYCTETPFKALQGKTSIGLHLKLCVQVILLHFLTLNSPQFDNMIMGVIDAHTTPQPRILRS